MAGGWGVAVEEKASLIADLDWRLGSTTIEGVCKTAVRNEEEGGIRGMQPRDAPKLGGPRTRCAPRRPQAVPAPLAGESC